MSALKSLMKRMNGLVTTWAAKAGNITKPPPMKCRCGKMFRKGLETWVRHWYADHPRLAKAYQAKEPKDRVNLLLVMMRNGEPKRRRVS